jgi:hypothetical protein
MILAAPLLKRLVAGFPPRRPGFDPGSDEVGFVVDRVALWKVFSEYFGFPCQSSFHQLLHNHPHLSSGPDIIGQKWPQYKGPSPTPLAIKKPWYFGQNFIENKPQVLRVFSVHVSENLAMFDIIVGPLDTHKFRSLISRNKSRAGADLYEWESVIRS